MEDGVRYIRHIEKTLLNHRNILSPGDGCKYHEGAVGVLGSEFFPAWGHQQRQLRGGDM